MSAPNVTKEENEVFGETPMPIRQTQYAKKIVAKDSKTTVNGLVEALAWKFGKCILKRETLKKIAK